MSGARGGARRGVRGGLEVRRQLLVEKAGVRSSRATPPRHVMPRRACAAQWRATHLVVAADEARRVLAQRRGLRRGRGGLSLGRLGAATQQLVVLGGQHKVAEQAADERRGLGAERLDVVERAKLSA